MTPLAAGYSRAGSIAEPAHPFTIRSDVAAPGQASYPPSAEASMSRGLWSRYREYLNVNPSIGVSVDISRMDFDDDFFSVMDAPMRRAFSEMDALEQGAIANPDEGRLVGHYWLRDAARAPNAEIRRQIEENLARIRRFAADVHAGRVRGERDHFLNLLVIGIGGSALGPHFVASALTTPRDPLPP